MVAANYDFVIEQGTTFIRIITYLDNNGDPIDLADYTAKMQIRKSYNEAVIIDMTTENDMIELNYSETGKIKLEISAEETNNMCFDTAIYDLELIDVNGTIKRFLQGKVTLSPGVTKYEQDYN